MQVWNFSQCSTNSEELFWGREQLFHGSDCLFDAKYTLRSGIGGVIVGEMRPLKKISSCWLQNTAALQSLRGGGLLRSDTVLMPIRRCGNSGPTFTAFYQDQDVTAVSSLPRTVWQS